MGIKTAVTGLGIMGQRMLQHMERHPEFEVVGIWDPDAGACQAALQFVPDAAIAANATAAMERAELVYLACPPAPRKAYALAALAAIETGWAVAHPWAQQREGWGGFVMILRRPHLLNLRSSSDSSKVPTASLQGKFCPNNVHQVELKSYWL